MLEAILNSSHDAIIAHDADGIISDWSQGAERLFGLSAVEMVGASILKVISADRQREENVIRARIERGETVWAYETEWQTKAGQAVEVMVTACPILETEGTVIGTLRVVRNLTLEKAHERELARLTRLYSVLSQVNQSIVSTRTHDELFQKVCEALVKHGGFRLAWVGWHDPQTQQIKPRAVWGNQRDYIQEIKVYADDRPEGRGPAGQSFRSGRPYVCNDMLSDPATQPWRDEFTRRGFKASGIFPIRLNQRVCGTLSVYSDEPGFFQDKEVALLAEAAGDVSVALDQLAQKEARHEVERVAWNEMNFSATMIESMPGILYLYDERGRFLRWNRNFEKVSGYSGEEIARMRPMDFFLDEEQAVLKRKMADVFEKGSAHAEGSFVAKDGTAAPYFFTGRRVLFNGAPCLVGIGIDITERKRAEMALRVLNRTLELEVAERTADLQAALVRAEAADRVKSAFLATMSHELRTPLNSIIGFTGIILQGLAGPLNEEQAKQLGMVRSSSRHLLELINDVLDLSKIEAGQMEVRREPFNLRELLARVTDVVRPLADKKGLELTLIAPAEVADMVGDRRRLEQLLLNLLNNGIKFTDHGRVTLTYEILPSHQRTPEAAAHPGARFRVADTGIGIKPEHLPNLFQPFHQIDTGTTRQFEGTGLGLAICRRLAALMGGDISATSEWTQGSEFVVTLPLQPPALK